MVYRKLTVFLLTLLFGCFCNNSSSIVFNGVKGGYVIYGDSRSQHEIHKDIVDRIIKVEPKAVFHTGDLVNDGDNPSDWSYFNDVTSRMRELSEFYPALGNHENDSPLYFNNFELPNNERWYEIQRGEILFIILDTNSDTSIGSSQYNWLSNTLANKPVSVKYIIAFFHHPPFNTGPHIEDEKNLRSTIVPLLEQYQTSMVFNGHDHDYERSYYNTVYYIVTGGGGAPLYAQERHSVYSQLFASTHHFCRLRIDGNLILEVYDLNYNLRDYLEIN